MKKEVVAQSVSTQGGNQVLDVTLPDLGENIESADVVNVMVKQGDNISKDQGIIEIETDKATVEVPSPYSGEVIEIFIKQGMKAKVGEALLKLKVLESTQAPQQKIDDTSAKPTKETAKEITPKIDAESITKEERTIAIPGQGYQQPPITKGSAPAAPSVRRIAREIGIDINEVPGTGTGGKNFHG
ncbi:MAG: E3 binding domain-containing protein [Ignavibacteriales bacterium]|nr:E3 binding domain-containing protein [Ignavibacteriales bacterium]